MLVRNLRNLTLTLTLALATVASTAAEAVTLRDTFQKTYPLSSGGRLEIENTNGGITIEAWDKAEVRLDAVKEVKAPDTADAEKLIKQIQIEVDSRPGALSVRTRLPKREQSGVLAWTKGSNINMNVKYTLWVPRELAVNATSTNGGIKLVGTRGETELLTTNGGIDVQRVEGRIDLRTTNGGINVLNSGGSLEAATTNGGITAELDDITGDRISLTTTNGGVTLKVPRSLRASIDASTSNGRVNTDLDLDGAQPGRKSLKAEVNGGGPDLIIRTTNGGVSIVGQ